MTDPRWMDRAVALASRGLGTTAPNPAVGAVIVRESALLGEGWTQPVGGPHAEVMALADARARGHEPRGATMYVTLEPCRHHGRTPPCTDAILAAGITRVVVGVVDPFPPMRGASLAQLREAGVEVTLGPRADACAALVRGFTRAITVGLPEVTVKAAASANGCIATHTGESQWITGEVARLDGHALRASHDAVLVGIGTVLADDPRLTVRGVPGTEARPIVLDSGLRTPADARVLQHPRRPLLLCAEDAPERVLDADIVRVPRGPGGLDVEASLRAAARAGLHRVLVEGGGQVIRSLIDARLVDTLHLYLSGVLIPGGLPWLGGAPLSALADAPRLGRPEVTALGDDLRLTWKLPHRAEEG